MTNHLPKLLSINEFCDLTGIGRTKAYQELSAGRLTALKIGRRTLIPVTSFEKWVDSQPAYQASH